jgi:acyl-CoA reductase-like NAD-dependent aldehyde dehydrogenase
MTQVTSNREPPVEARMLIDGEWIDGANRIDVRNPARPDELVGTIVRGEPADVDHAILAAKRAQRAWAAKSFVERAAMLATALDRIDQDIERRATLFVRENGKTLREATQEVAGTGHRQRMALRYAAELDAGRKMPAPHGRTLVITRPYGVVVSIVPWNSPISLAFTQIVAALLAGNGVVLKPPETCPLALIQTVGLFAEALPKGIINIVTGMPSEIGDALTTHPDVAKIGFTGSIASASHIMANAAQSIKGVTLELGGNDAAVLLADAELSQRSVDAMAAAAFQMTGQVCMAIKRIFVPKSIAQEFKTEFVNAANRIVVGDGLDPGVTMGPLHTRRALDRAHGLVDDAVRRGARIVRAGKIADEAVDTQGYFMQPIIVTDLADDAPLMREEQFCPVLPIAVYDDLDSAVQRANDTIYGLSASIWSRDVERALQLAPRLEAGQVWINAHGPHATNHLAPYGGVKQSGIGRKSGLEGIQEYLQSQTITTYESDA